MRAANAPSKASSRIKGKGDAVLYHIFPTDTKDGCRSFCIVRAYDGARYVGSSETRRYHVYDRDVRAINEARSIAMNHARQAGVPAQIQIEG